MLGGCFCFFQQEQQQHLVLVLVLLLVVLVYFMPSRDQPNLLNCIQNICKIILFAKAAAALVESLELAHGIDARIILMVRTRCHRCTPFVSKQFSLWCVILSCLLQCAEAHLGDDARCEHDAHAPPAD